MNKDELLKLAERLNGCPDVMHARITPVSRRETEYIVPASLKFAIDAALRALAEKLP